MQRIKTSIGLLNEGCMIIWSTIEEAARYWITLSIGTKKKKYVLCKVEKDRETKWHSFLGLPKSLENLWITRSENYSYYVSVEAENRQGQVIAASTLKEVANYDEEDDYYDYDDE